MCDVCCALLVLFVLLILVMCDQAESTIEAEINFIPAENQYLSLVPSSGHGVDQNKALHASSTAKNSACLISPIVVHSTSFFQ